ALGEIVPITDARRNQLLHEDRERIGTSRFNFAFQAEYGRVYKAGVLRTDSGSINDLQIERRGSGPAYPTYLLSAKTAHFDPKTQIWTLGTGALDVVSDSNPGLAIYFEKALDEHLVEKPAELMARQRPPQELTYRELSRSIAAAERSGS